jgi:hypothetical protein
MPRTYGVPIKFGSRPPPLRATRCEPDYCVMYALTVRPNRPLAWSLQIPIIRDTWRDRRRGPAAWRIGAGPAWRRSCGDCASHGCPSARASRRCRGTHGSDGNQSSKSVELLPAVLKSSLSTAGTRPLVSLLLVGPAERSALARHGTGPAWHWPGTGTGPDCRRSL